MGWQFLWGDYCQATRSERYETYKEENINFKYISPFEKHR
jgi:hypothetical protein